MNHFLRATRSVALTLAFVVAIAAPAFSLDRVQWLYGLNPPSSWMTTQERAARLGVGQWMFNALGSGNGYFSNLSVAPATGLNVTVGPTSANTLASLYQYLADDTSPFGGPGATALPVDNTLITLQGLMTPAQAQTLGPLNPPGTAGQSIIYAIECKVNTVDTTSQTVNFVTSSGTVTSGSANRDRADQIFCQAKAGTASSSPVAPTIDTGYLGVSTVTVAYGASSISAGNISATTASGFYGFALVSSSGLAASLPVCTNVNAKLTTSGCNAGTVTSVTASSPLASSGGTTPNITLNGIVPQANGGTGASSVQGAGLPPVYNASGTIQTASSLHAVLANCTQSGSATCVVNFSGSAVFSSFTSYVCALSDPSGSGTSIPYATNVSGSSTDFNEGGVSNHTLYGYCVGT